ncbi:MAG: hypothetical protein B1H08_06715 [Candidatus Omnitrophica bacterium 4484_171]|nr:MAG: hypothetical protein B1H08_06715 [Candidatus Omnitrophica bacterium 4484_171]
MKIITKEDVKNYKYPYDFVNKIICGNCLDLIKLIPDGEIDCIITDPPYGLNKNGIKNDADYCPEGGVRSPIGRTKYMSCFLFRKGNPRLIQRKTDIYKDTPGKMVEPDEGFINHPTPKPKHFIKQIIEMTTLERDLILDPFIGSGSTAVASKQLNRKFIGFEIQEKYCRLANERLARIK